VDIAEGRGDAEGFVYVGFSGVGVDVAGEEAGAAALVPQLVQNLEPGRRSLPHLTQKLAEVPPPKEAALTGEVTLPLNDGGWLIPPPMATPASRRVLSSLTYANLRIIPYNLHKDITNLLHPVIHSGVVLSC